MPGVYSHFSKCELSTLVTETPDAIFDLYISNYKKSEKYDKSVIQEIKDYIKYMALAIQIFEFKKESKLYGLEQGEISSEEKPVKEVSVKKVKPKTKYHSFTYIKWVNDSSKLTDLMKSLKRKKLIADNTELPVFRKVFGGGPIIKPVVWTGVISELYYFISQLHNKLEYVENLKQDIWAVTINCFVQENGEFYDRTKLRTQKVPATSKNIDSVLKTLK